MSRSCVMPRVVTVFKSVLWMVQAIDCGYWFGRILVTHRVGAPVAREVATEPGAMLLGAALMV